MTQKIEMVGKKYGDWLVLEECGLLYDRPAYLCQCKCGYKKIINGNFFGLDFRLKEEEDGF